jgi:putative FmdB family regulatory protein
MPTYDYKCDACRHKFEQSQSITAGPLKKCPKCGKLKLKRLLGTGVGVIFKGSGFYETDYRSDSYKKSAQSDKTAASTSTETKTEPKTDSKTETKKEPKPAATETKTESKPSSKKKSS